MRIIAITLNHPYIVIIATKFLGVSDSNPGAYNLQIDDVCVYDQEYYEEMEVDVASFETINVEFPEWCLCNWQNWFDSMPER